MSSIDDAKIRILRQVPLDSLIGESVKLKKSSGNKVGVCPFHEEKDGSFYVYPDHYFCFGCRERGDAIDFVRKIHGLGFIDALKYLSQKFGIPAPELDQSENYQKQRSEDLTLFKILSSAQEWFRKNLKHDSNKRIYDYLKQRGFSDGSIDEFEFGFAPDDPQLLLKTLTSQGYNSKDIETCSLVSPSSKNGQLYDFHRNRITIPIRDSFGRIVGFGGRNMGDYGAKYKNSRESRLFDKSALLFGFHKAKDHIRKGQPAIIVEGYMDVLQLWQHDLRGAVACMGVALKNQHLQLLANITSQLFLIFDADTAGQKATLSAVKTNLEFPSVQIKVVILPSGEDPDSFVKNHGSNALREKLDSATELFDFAIVSKLKNANGSLQVIKIIKDDFIPWLSQIPDPLQRGYLLNKLSSLSGIEKKEIESSIYNQYAGSSKRTQTTSTDIYIIPTNLAKTQDRIDANLKPSPPKPLIGLDFELIGHLYYSEPSEIDTEKVETFISANLQTDEIWIKFASIMLLSLKGGKPPRETLKELQIFNFEPEVLNLIDKLNYNATAFEVGSRSECISKIMAIHRKKALKNAINSLKSSLPTASTEERNKILSEITAINRELASF